MRNVQRSIIAIGVMAIAGFGSVSGAAAKPKSALKVAPAKPGVKTPIAVSFKAPKMKRPRGYYAVDLTIGDGTGPRCGGLVPSVLLRASAGRTFTATLKPNPGRWCDGQATVEVRRYGSGVSSPVLARRTFPIGTGVSVPRPDLPAKITVLGGSTLTATAAGRPDRSAQLTGVLRGTLRGGFKPTLIDGRRLLPGDLNVEQISGSLTPLGAALAQAVFPPDPLCPDTKPPGTFDAVPTSSTLVLPANGAATFNLTLNGAASQLFGCGPAGPLNGTSTLPLTGKPAPPKGLLELGMTGSVTGIPLPAGSQGGLAASLVLMVEPGKG